MHLIPFSIVIYGWLLVIFVENPELSFSLTYAEMVSDRKTSIPGENDASRFLERMAVLHIRAARQRTGRSCTEEGPRRNVANQTEFVIYFL